MQARHASSAKKSDKGGAIQARLVAPGGADFGRAEGLKDMADKDAATPPGARVSDDGKARQAREEARLAAALRANLARRKQQTRARAAGDEDEGPG